MPHASSSPEKTAHGVTISFEIFPPKTDTGMDKLQDVVQRLASLQPQFVSVTCGAGGSAIDGTTAIVRRLSGATGVDIAPHIATARQSRSRVRDALHIYKSIGISRVVAIRGDDAQAPETVAKDDSYPNTIDFVAELRCEFGIEPIVAAYPDVHPRALSPQQDLDHLKRKEEAGAAFAISQFFFVAETFLRFRDTIRAAGIRLPLAAGILPIHNLTQTLKFATGCGAVVPSGFAARFERRGDDPAAQFEEGIAHATELCEHLRREGVEHFHFYTLNRSDMTETVCKELGFGGQGSGFRVQGKRRGSIVAEFPEFCSLNPDP
jgi:methylenetetrahydrofolate reductase (NADPH)